MPSRETYSRLRKCFGKGFDRIAKMKVAERRCYRKRAGPALSMEWHRAQFVFANALPRTSSFPYIKNTDEPERELSCRPSLDHAPKVVSLRGHDRSWRQPRQPSDMPTNYSTKRSMKRFPRAIHLPSRALLVRRER